VRGAATVTRAWGGWRRTWASYQGVALLVLLVGALALGYVGYRSYFAQAGEARAWYDLLYYDLQLLTFTTQSAADPDLGLPWTLQVARFLAPLAAGYGAVLGLLRLFRDRFDQARARFRRRHSIVAGAGETGLAFVRALRARDRKVVVLDDDPANPHLEACRELGAVVVQADARKPESLAQAGLADADHLVAVCGDDARNAEIVLNAQQVRRRRARRPLRCLAHIVDPELWQLLRANEVRGDSSAPVRFDFFNLHEHGARALLDEHPPPSGDDHPPEVIVAGTGPLADRIVVTLARRYGDRPGATDRVRVTVLAAEASRFVEQLVDTTPRLPASVDLLAVDRDPTADSPRLNGPLSADIAYICSDSDSDGVVLAQALRARLVDTPIVVVLTGSDGLVRVLSRSPAVGPPGLRRVEAFPLLDRACHPDSLLAGVHESLAQAIHERFRRARLAEGVAADDPRVAPWLELPDDLRQSNRSQAASVGRKLRLVGCDLVPDYRWTVLPFAFTSRELALLARDEHERWRDERTAQGWHSGPVRDDVHKRNPLLVPWDELPAEARSANRAIVESIPEVVEQAGYRIVRVRPPAEEEPWIEPVARAIHDHYRTARGTGSTGASTRPWDELDERLRRSNRAQAADLALKLASIGCRIVPADAPTRIDGFTAAEVEDLARQEHDRWVDERAAAGWRLGPRGDHTSPDLVGWDDLPDDRRELDREAVRAIPAVLAAAGMGVDRSA
jgi:hypothetical protein